jgi:hypothetical protein
MATVGSGERENPGSLVQVDAAVVRVDELS